jgi:hypothetical protein
VRALRSTLNELEGLLQKHTLYQVETRSISLREQQKKHHVFSYDDFYGESSAPIPEDEPVGCEVPRLGEVERHRKRSGRSKFFTQVREKEFSFSDFDEPGVRINLDLDGMERENSDR